MYQRIERRVCAQSIHASSSLRGSACRWCPQAFFGTRCADSHLRFNGRASSTPVSRNIRCAITQLGSAELMAVMPRVRCRKRYDLSGEIHCLCALPWHCD